MVIWSHSAFFNRLRNSQESVDPQLRNSSINLKGGMTWEVGERFKRKGTYVYLWLIHTDVWPKPTQYGKAIILQVRVGPQRRLSTGSQCFPTVVLEKAPESPLDRKEIKLVHSKGNQPWIFIGRTDAEAGVPIFGATCCEELTHWKRPWCWERLRTREGGSLGWDG